MTVDVKARPKLDQWVRDLIEIRRLEPDDLPEIMKFTPEAARPALHYHQTLVATMYGTIIGYASYYLDGKGTFYHGALRVVELYQGEGVGTRLMAARVAIARDFHVPEHHALVLTDKPAMMKLCERFGMVPTRRYDGTRVLYVGDLLGEEIPPKARENHCERGGYLCRWPDTTDTNWLCTPHFSKYQDVAR